MPIYLQNILSCLDILFFYFSEVIKTLEMIQLDQRPMTRRQNSEIFQMGNVEAINTGACKLYSENM